MNLKKMRINQIKNRTLQLKNKKKYIYLMSSNFL